MKNCNFFKILYLTIIFILCFSNKILAQSNFDLGFKSGFINGYCYSNQSSSYCLPPFPPLPPMPQTNENVNSHLDGYNRGFLYGQAYRNKEDNNSSNNKSDPNKTTFTPYVSQSPITSMSNQERSNYYAARAKRDQDIAEGIASLLNEIFTVNPEKKAKRAKKRVWNQEKKRIKAEIKTERKKFAKSIKFQSKPEPTSVLKPELSKPSSPKPDSTPEPVQSNSLSKNLINSNIEKKLKYFCLIYEKDFVNGKFQKKDTFKGYITIYDNYVIFENGNNKALRRYLSNEKEDVKTKTFSYNSEYGNVEIDYQKKEVRFYDESNKKCWVYDIIILAQ